VQVATIPNSQALFHLSGAWKRYTTRANWIIIFL